MDSKTASYTSRWNLRFNGHIRLHGSFARIWMEEKTHFTCKTRISRKTLLAVTADGTSFVLYSSKRFDAPDVPQILTYFSGLDGDYAVPRQSPPLLLTTDFFF
ncbi:hypothetical protein CDAR_301471 [Caerostris darwini]|uniref:SH2 domain-containing protein n=1 Tax=Caerostris darwini TaxID=1538125 RepID=A0AAV4WV20_9ARAC|nr:hypothetical protein CDAR_301471 [Caerostris darwini]